MKTSLEEEEGKAISQNGQISSFSGKNL